MGVGLMFFAVSVLVAVLVGIIVIQQSRGGDIPVIDKPIDREAVDAVLSLTDNRKEAFINEVNIGLHDEDLSGELNKLD